MDIEWCPRNLYLQMEREREETLETRSDFVPFFIAKLIRDTLELADTENSDFLLQDNVKVVIEKILTFAEIVRSTIGLKRNDFCRHFCEQVRNPSLELICLMEVKYNLMEITSYLMQLTFKNDTSNFREQFLSFCSSSYLQDSTNRGNCLHIFEKLLESIIITTVCKNTNDSLLVQLKSFSSDLLRQVTSCMSSSVSNLEDVQKFIFSEIQSLPLPMSIKKQYFTEQLTFILSEKSKLSTEEVIQQQEKLSFQPVNCPKTQMINLLIQDPQPPLETLKMVINIVSQQNILCQVNWENILLTITLWEKMYENEFEAVKYLKEQIKQIMLDGISQNNQDKMTISFILARHCSLISPKIFFRYEAWYKNMFEQEQFSPIREASTFTLFTEFLTNWIPIEPLCFLQVQASYWPHIPTGCKFIWNDYISLAKARVQEYNEIENVMELEAPTGSILQSEVDSAIKTFGKTGTVPPAVSMSFMCRKQYYISTFLPALLKQPVGVASTDARLRFIELLNSLGKIPQHLYKKYKTGGFNNN